MRTLPALALAALALGTPVPALARPHGPPPAGQREGAPPKMDRAQREKMLRKMHTMAVIELGELLGLDTAGTIKLSDKLSRYADQRVQLQLDSFDAMEQIRRIARGEGTADVASLARRVAQNRVQLAQIDQSELNDVITGLPPEKAAEATLLLARFPKRMEHLAGKARGMGGGRGMTPPDGPGGGGDLDDGE